MLDRIVDDTRDEVKRRRKEVLAEAAREADGAPRRGLPPVLRGAHAARHLADRRAQAPLAVGGDDPRGEQGRGRRARLRARRRRGALDPHRAVPLRRLARRPARGPRGLVAARAAQGLHRRPLPALRGGRGRGGRDPADRRRAGDLRARRPAARGRGRWTSTRSSRSTTSASSRRALEVEADVLGINNRDLSDFSVDIERTYELLADVPAGKTVVSESGFSTRDQLDELERVGVDAVLIGETLMRAPDIEAACRELTGGGERFDQGQDLRDHAARGRRARDRPRRLGARLHPVAAVQALRRPRRGGRDRARGAAPGRDRRRVRQPAAGRDRRAGRRARRHPRPAARRRGAVVLQPRSPSARARR